tara:strand:- start:724808 stop:725485 length:678 start_codon:yes stop_codon:yes gene_type:complete
MKTELKTLIVDDHPMIVEAYKNILTSSDIDNYTFSVDTAKDCDSAIQKIDSSVKSVHYDILFFDIKLPPSTDGKIISGEGLAAYAKNLLPKARIVILTMFNEGHRIHNILKTANPDGLLVKNDLTSKEFLVAFETIMNDPPYYSKTVAKFFRNQANNLREPLLDEINRKIIFHLSKGVKTKDLTIHINLSLSAIEKRKTLVKSLLGLDSANDEELIREAKNRGFI